MKNKTELYDLGLELEEYKSFVRTLYFQALEIIDEGSWNFDLVSDLVMSILDFAEWQIEEENEGSNK